MTYKIDLPKAHFGSVDKKASSNWKTLIDEDADDEELKSTPKYIVKMLGFDPKFHITVKKK